jgi:sucrose-6-phosphate hydrolase SacC (GH32 family)
VIERAGAIFNAPSVTNRQVLALAPREGCVLLHVLVDSASVEIFADDGRCAVTIQTAPASAEIGAQLFAAGGTVIFEVLQAWMYGEAMPNGRPTL